MAGIDAGIYASGSLYPPGGKQVVEELRRSGMTTVIVWCIHVHANGDLAFNDTVIVSEGKYVGDREWPNLILALKQQPSTVNRLLFSVGSAEVPDFPNIKRLIEEQGTGPQSILARNFGLLKKLIPAIDGIDFDDEELFEVDTTVKFAKMLNQLRFTVTFCPFGDTDFWVECLEQLNGATPGLVSGFNLQCYAGGSGNEPGPWIEAIEAAMGPKFDAKQFMRPGLWCRNGESCEDGECPKSIFEKFRSWKRSGINGGWIWMLNDIEHCRKSGACQEPMDTPAYAKAIVSGLS
jgi:hypothetical protein